MVPALSTENSQLLSSIESLQRRAAILKEENERLERRVERYSRWRSALNNQRHSQQDLDDLRFKVDELPELEEKNEKLSKDIERLKNVIMGLQKSLEVLSDDAKSDEATNPTLIRPLGGGIQSQLDEPRDGWEKLMSIVVGQCVHARQTQPPSRREDTTLVVHRILEELDSTGLRKLVEQILIRKLDRGSVEVEKKSSASSGDSALDSDGDGATTPPTLPKSAPPQSRSPASREAVDARQAKVAQFKQRLLDQKQKIAELEEENEKLKRTSGTRTGRDERPTEQRQTKEISELRREIEWKDRELTAKKAEIDYLRRELGQTKEEVCDAVSEQQRFAARVRACEDIIDELRQVEADYQACLPQLEQLRRDHAQLTERIGQDRSHQLAAVLNAPPPDEQVSLWQSKMADLEKENQRLKMLEKEYHLMRQQLNELEWKDAGSTDQLSPLRGRVTCLTAKCHQKEETIQKLRKVIKGLQWDQLNASQYLLAQSPSMLSTASSETERTDTADEAMSVQNPAGHLSLQDIDCEAESTLFAAVKEFDAVRFGSGYKDSINLHEGEVVRVLKPMDANGFCLVRSRTRCGHVPANYLVPAAVLRECNRPTAKPSR